MFFNIDIESDFNITTKKSKKIFKTNIFYKISKNGYFYDNYPGLINLKSYEIEKTAKESFIIAHPLDFNSLVEKIEDKNIYDKSDLYNFKKEKFPKGKENVFWEFSKSILSFDFTTNDEFKEKIINFTNKYGLLTEGTLIISDKYKKNIDSIEKNKKKSWEHSDLTTQKMNTYYIILKGESIILWLKEIIQMRSLVLLWEAIEKKNYNLLKKIFYVVDHNYYNIYNLQSNYNEKTYNTLNKFFNIVNHDYYKKIQIYEPPNNNEKNDVYFKLKTLTNIFNNNTRLIKYRLFPYENLLNNYNDSSFNNDYSKDKNDNFDERLEWTNSRKDKFKEKSINGFMKDKNGNLIFLLNKEELDRNELIYYGKLLLNNLLKIKLTSLFSLYLNTTESNEFFMKFTEDGVKIVPPNLLTYLWFEFYNLTKEKKEIGWCSVCGGPEDITNKNSRWEKHKKCSNREAQKKYRDWNYYKSGKRSKEKIINTWKDLSWGQAIDIKDIKKWFNKKVKEKKKE